MLEISTNNFNNNKNDFNSQNDFADLLRQENFDKEQEINTLNNFNNNKALEEKFYETQNKYKIIEKKLLENIEDLLNTEKKLNAAYNKNEILSKENTLIKNQLSYVENAFNNMKKRKQEENEELRKE